MTRKLLDDCFLHDGERMRHADALALLASRVTPVAGVETVDLAASIGRVLAEPAVAAIDVPAHTNAAVDGYSFASGDYDRVGGTTFATGGRAAAGHPLAIAPAPGCAVRIFTGAVLPAGHDTVVMQEDCERLVVAGREAVRIPGGLKAAANVRHAGEDVRAGATLMGSGQVIRPQDAAGLASIGIARVSVFNRLRVALASSGDEIVAPGAPLAPGQVFDANAPMIEGLLATAGVSVTRLGILPDDADAVRECLLAAAAAHDLILTSGGASRGEEDHMVATLDAIGRRHLWQLAVKPGRPMLFGQIGDCAVVGLPGNPVAVLVCFLMYVWPLLRRLGGADWPEPRRYPLPAAFTFEARKTGRREFWRGILRQTDAGLVVDKFARDGSGLISGLRAADGLIEIGEDVAAVRPGDTIDFIPFTEFGIGPR